MRTILFIAQKIKKKLEKNINKLITILFQLELECNSSIFIKSVQLSLLSMHGFMSRFFSYVLGIYVEVMQCVAILAYNKLSYFELKRKHLYENNSIYWSNF